MATREARQQNKSQNQQNQNALKELLKKAENKKCADCKTRDSRWASVNLGVFLCIQCSGIHRAMGTHISKVRSVDLDTWTTEQVSTMKELGNAQANAYWEANLPHGFIPGEDIEKFIRAKYERKMYAGAARAKKPAFNEVSPAPAQKQKASQPTEFADFSAFLN